MKREIVLNPEQVKAILIQAKQMSLRDYLIFKTMTVGDFRIGEVVGSAARFWVPYCQSCKANWFKSRKEGPCEKCGVIRTHNSGEWIKAEPTVPGLLIEDIRENGIWVQGKGWKRAKSPTPPVLQPLPGDLLEELKAFVGDRKKGKIFNLTIDRVWQLARNYAKKAGLTDWKLVHPHRFRHFTTTQVGRKFGVVAARDIARHKNLATTNRYISELPEDEKRKIIEEQDMLLG